MKPEDIIKATRNSLNIYAFTAEALEKLIAAIQSEHKCQTCEALARTVMMDQTAYDTQTAASDLLNALKRIVNEPNNTMSDGKALKEIIRIARLAIAKATGETK